jgi:SsrA-binding protein
MPKPPANPPHTPRVSNKRARFDFELLERIEAGLALKGTEVKSIRLGNASLNEAYARVEGGQAYLINFQILPYEQGNIHNHDPKRPKLLLLHRRQIKKLASSVQVRGLTLIPVSVYFNAKGLAKVEIALARGRSRYDKRDTTRKKEDKREMDRARRAHKAR